MAYDAGRNFDAMYPEGREAGRHYRNHEFNRIMPLYLLPEYLRRLPPTLLMSSNIVISDVLEMTIAFLKSREAVDTDEGLTYLFNRLMLEKTQKAYYRFIEKQYDSIAIMASMISKISTML